MNEKALEAATKALKERVGNYAFYHGVTAAQTAQEIIEAYHAALPDEDGLVKELRQEIAEMQTRPPVSSIIWELLSRAADALEAARVRLAECYERSNEAHQELADMEAASVIPKGWRLVPEEPTPDQENAGRTSFNSSLTGRENCVLLYKAMLAAAPEHQKI